MFTKRVAGKQLFFVIIIFIFELYLMRRHLLGLILLILIPYCSRLLSCALSNLLLLQILLLFDYHIRLVVNILSLLQNYLLHLLYLLCALSISY